MEKQKQVKLSSLTKKEAIEYVKKASKLQLINDADKLTDEILKANKVYKIIKGASIGMVILSLGGVGLLFFSSNSIIKGISAGVGLSCVSGQIFVQKALKKNGEKLSNLQEVINCVLQELQDRTLAESDAKEIFGDVLGEQNQRFLKIAEELENCD